MEVPVNLPRRQVEDRPPRRRQAGGPAPRGQFGGSGGRRASEKAGQPCPAYATGLTST